MTVADSESFHPGTLLHFPRPSAARLPKDRDVGLRDRVRVKCTLRTVGQVNPPVAPYTVVNDEVHYVNPLRR